MLHFPILRTRRLTVQLRELTIGESIKLAAIPSHLNEASCTEFLKYAVESTTGVDDVKQWTVQERTFVVSHYLASALGSDPNFSLGTGNYFDYLDLSIDIAADFKPVDVGMVGDNQWYITHLIGKMSESIERLLGEFPDVTTRLHWLLGGMAAQLICDDEISTEFETDGQYDEWLLNRMRIYAAYPESDFEQLMIAYNMGRDLLHHLFYIDFNGQGIVALPREAGGNLPPARFPVSTCISRMAKDLGG